MGLGITGLVFGTVSLRVGRPYLVAFLVYASTLILMMTVSTLYHALIFTRSAAVFKTLDHSGIFLLIAGSYTPFIVKLFHGTVQIIFLAILWSVTAAGIALAATLRKTMAKFEIAVYVIMGWFAVIFFIPKLSAMPRSVLWLVVSGGVLYTVGALFQPGKKPFFHVVWHMFVNVAATLHFLAILLLARAV